MYPPQREALLYVFCTASFCKQMYGLLPRTIGKDSLLWLFAAASNKKNAPTFRNLPCLGVSFTIQASKYSLVRDPCHHECSYANR